MRKKKQLEVFLFSVGGVVAMFVLLVALYIIASAFKARVDLTEHNLYTLSDGTKRILAKLDTPVEVRFYYSQDSKAMPVPLKTYAQRIEDLLAEYEKAGKGMVEVREYDPEPDSDAEDLANLDGVQGQMVNFGDKIYLGIAVSMLDSKATIPFLSPDRETLLEYDISRAIASVMSTEKPVVGVMSSLPVFGQPANPMMMMRMPQQAQEPWVFISELRRDFEVREVESSASTIPEDMDVLVVVHPKNLSDSTQYAIDQFVLRGGRLIAFVDPFSIADSQLSPQGNPLQAATTSGSNMEKLFKAWGLTFDEGKVVADMTFVTQINQGGQVQQAPAVLSVNPEGISDEDVITSQIDNLLLAFAGAFVGTPAEGLTKTVLLSSTERSQLVDRFMAQFSGEQIAKEFAPSDTKYDLAVRLTGKFKTAFPEGKPASSNDQEQPQASAEAEGLKEGEKEAAVILVGDTDLLYDQFSVQVQQIFGQRIVIPRNGNLNLVQNSVEQMAGDSDLIMVRSRATMRRPFTVVRELQQEAEERYRSKIRELEQSLTDAQTRLNQLQVQKEGDQRFILSPEQQAEIQRFQEKEIEVKRELKEVRKDLRREIDALENRLKWANIAAMPVLVTVFGLGLALVKRKRTAAK